MSSEIKTPYKYRYTLGSDAERTPDGKRVIYHRGERMEIEPSSVEFHSDLSNPEPMTRAEFDEVTKGTKGIVEVIGVFKEDILDTFSLSEHEKESLQAMIDGMTDQCLAGECKYKWSIMEDNKYYTPSIEEFHVGFEYERMNGDRWEKSEITETDFSAMLSGIDEENEYDEIYLGIRSVRVKYLDKEDIEELGWKDIEDRGMSENYGYMFTKPIQYLSGGNAYYKLRYWTTNNRLRIENLGGCMFDGTIKNKSELKRLLIQLDIDEK